VKVHGLSYLISRVESHQSLLIVDDVYDSGLSIAQTIIDLERACKKNMPEVRIATPYFKPANNKTERTPEYFVYESTEWLVFPHEIEGLSYDEVVKNKPGFKEVADEMKRLGKFDS